MTNDQQVRGQHTQEFKREAVRRVKTGQSIGMTASATGCDSGTRSGEPIVCGAAVDHWGLRREMLQFAAGN